MSGCDGNSALYRRGKAAAFKAVDSVKDLSFLDVFKAKTSTHEEIKVAGEMLLLRAYTAPATVDSLDELRYVRYKKQVAKKSLTAGTGFDLKSLPPTTDAAKYHSYRAYFQVLKWLGNTDVSPTDWGWTTDAQSGHLVPIVKDQAAAPDKVLKMISCGCKQGCNRSCKCKKAGLLCTILCSGGNGTDCSNCGRDESDV